MSELNLVKGINARQIKLLQENGVSTAEALAMSTLNIVADIDGLGDKTAKKLIWNARNALGMTEFITAEDIDENTDFPAEWFLVVTKNLASVISSQYRVPAARRQALAIEAGELLDDALGYDAEPDSLNIQPDIM